ncbi:hypothetical protein ARMGADRAFT_1037237 [Armillaria gallica]|uniref:Uncharacterized protein n=1 Tax=Armillaria gallica TaxID=47427 RepID=A0A2H3CMM4_ARMGA|nr:hypothetical protein ARMGADRAFT_1037237 [Armillaria gallica]
MKESGQSLNLQAIAYCLPAIEGGEFGSLHLDAVMTYMWNIDEPVAVQAGAMSTMGFSAAKQSSLVWSLPISCRQFLEMPLDPEQSFELHAGGSDQDIQILQFGKAMARSLKSVADEGWNQGDPQMHIDDLSGGHSQTKSAGLLETLVLVKATDIAAGFL